MAVINQKKLALNVGQISPFAVARVTLEAAEDTANTYSLNFAELLRNIQSLNVMHVSSTGQQKLPLVTFSGTTVTVADGTSTLAVNDVLYIQVFGDPK
jgi:hypothetical protein